MAVIFPKNTSNIKVNVLIVDDSRLVCDNIKDAIEAVGHFACYEINSLKALELFKAKSTDNENKFDLVIVDQIMPKMDGLTLIEEIHQIDRNVNILMFTVDGKNIELENKALALGIRAFLDKENPNRIDNIIHTILPIFEEKKKRL